MRFPRSSGILLHPTSLPGPHGSGDLGPAAYHFIDWLVTAGQALWQVLPLGPIGPGNSPYMGSSAFAGNPLLIDLADLAARGWLDSRDLVRAIQSAKHLSAQRVDFAAVIPFRMALLRRASRGFFFAGGANDTGFTAFREVQQSWLTDYALFMALGEQDRSREWNDWKPGLARREPAALASASHRHAEEIRFWEFVQWNFFRQWQNLKRYANERGVKIVGDIPIFIALHSADAWVHPQLFHLDAALRPTVVAGVPPDFFSKDGQLWGNPLYRWTAHENEGYAWWIARVRAMTQLTDILRIDHFRGFAGYWEIPADAATAVEGRWAPGPGAKFFTGIRAALGRLPIIAEDLGVMTDDVIELRDAFQLPGMRVLQFAFNSGAENTFLPHNYVPNTVVYTGTHDNDTSRGWYTHASAEERAFARTYLNNNGNDIHWALMHVASQSVADMALYPFQDVLGLGSEARMNLPGKAEGYWEWRFDWNQVDDSHARGLREMSVAHGRNGIALSASR